MILACRFCFADTVCIARIAAAKCRLGLEEAHTTLELTSVGPEPTTYRHVFCDHGQLQTETLVFERMPPAAYTQTVN